MLILQHGEGTDGVGHRRGDPAGHQLAVGSSSCLVNSLCIKKKINKRIYRINVLSRDYRDHNNELCSLEESHGFFREYAPLTFLQSMIEALHQLIPLPTPEQLTSSFVTQEYLSDQLENTSLLPNSHLIKLNSNLFISRKLCLARENVTVTTLSETGDITLFSKLATRNC